MQYWLHPDAEQDIADALNFYATHAGRSVAQRFLAEFDTIATLLIENPGLGTPSSKGRRTFPLRVFPYSVVYHPWKQENASSSFGTNTENRGLARQ